MICEFSRSYAIEKYQFLKPQKHSETSYPTVPTATVRNDFNGWLLSKYINYLYKVK